MLWPGVRGHGRGLAALPVFAREFSCKEVRCTGAARRRNIATHLKIKSAGLASNCPHFLFGLDSASARWLTSISGFWPAASDPAGSKHASSRLHVVNQYIVNCSLEFRNRRETRVRTPTPLILQFFVTALSCPQHGILKRCF